MALWKEDFVVVNKYSRPATKLVGVRGIVMHWTATNGASDDAEKNFFDGSDGGGGRYASAHMFIDRDSATLIIPLNEVAYHANEKPCKIAKLQATANGYTGGANLTAIGIEMCVEKDGTIHPDTVARAADIVTELCKRYNLNPLTDIYRHYDITGKNCPAPWVSNPQQFIDFKNNVNLKLHPVVIKQQSEEVIELLEKAVVIGGYPDLSMAELVSLTLHAPIYFRSAIPAGKIAKEVYVVGGSVDGIQADKVINLTGVDRFAVVDAVKKFLGK